MEPQKPEKPSIFVVLRKVCPLQSLPPTSSTIPEEQGPRQPSLETDTPRVPVPRGDRAMWVRDNAGPG